MSYASEQAYEKWFAQHLIECRRDLVIGAKVYRAAWDMIEEGVVCGLSKGSYDKWTGDLNTHDDKGTVDVFWAKFGNSSWQSQTRQYEWFFAVEDAKKDLIRQLRRRIEDKQREIAKWEKLILATEV